MTPHYTCILFSGDGRALLQYDNMALVSCHDSTALLMFPDGRKCHVSGCFVLVEQVVQAAPAAVSTPPTAPFIRLPNDPDPVKT